MVYALTVGTTEQIAGKRSATVAFVVIVLAAAGPAYEIGGSYTKGGAQQLAAQKTVVIPGSGGIYVLQLNAEGPETDASLLMDATKQIDDKTRITP